MRVMGCTLVLLATETITVNYTWTVFMLGKSKVSGVGWGGGGGVCAVKTSYGLVFLCIQCLPIPDIKLCYLSCRGL